MSENTAYARLAAHGRESAHLSAAASLLAWDQRAMLPPKGHAQRAEQLALLARMLHEREVDPGRGEDIAAAEAWLARLGADPFSAEAVNVREWRRSFDRSVKLPARLVQEVALASSLAETAWERARPANDWAGFQPHLETLLRLRREEAEAVGYAKEPYDALLDVYEQGETAAALVPLFAELRVSLSGLLDRLREKAPLRAERVQAVRRARFGLRGQERFGRAVTAALGFDPEAGRIDVSAHPFMTRIAPGDVRLTTRFSASDFRHSLYSMIHETGHALYEQGLSDEHWGVPMGEAASLGVHESQSRLWENFVGRSLGFWRHFLPLARTQCAGLAKFSAEDLFLAVNEVKPTLIRTEADEVTYNLHVILRFELELALLRGDLLPADIPAAWNEKMHAFLGLTPPDHARGALQDVHWAAGLFGYFPTYTLGNLYAAQLFAAATEALGPLEALFARGEFAPLLDWLRRSIHGHGKRFTPRELVQRATGKALSPQALSAYFEAKFAAMGG